MGNKPVRDKLKGVTTGAQLLRAYSRGFPGVYSDPKEREKFLDIMDYNVGMDAASDYGWMDEAKGKLVIPFKNTEMLISWWTTWASTEARRLCQPFNGQCLRNDNVLRYSWGRTR